MHMYSVYCVHSSCVPCHSDRLLKLGEHCDTADQGLVQDTRNTNAAEVRCRN